MGKMITGNVIDLAERERKRRSIKDQYCFFLCAKKSTRLKNSPIGHLPQSKCPFLRYFLCTVCLVPLGK